MAICIICRKEKEEMSDEHVIPDALGGYFHISSVCKECNSIMGEKVDSKLVNHLMAKQMRFLFELKGKGGEIPNPFAGTHHFSNDELSKVRLIPEKGKGFVPYILPKTSEEKIDENTYNIHISFDDKDYEKKDEILDKKLKRLGFNRNQIISQEISTIAKKGLTVETHLFFDLVEFKIGLLKIAYEFAVTNIPDYFEDTMAIEISNVLRNGLYDQVSKFANVGNGFNKDLLKMFSNFFDFESKKHYLILFNNNGKLYCLVSIFNTFAIGVQLSNSSYLYGIEVIVGVNNFVNGEYYVNTLFEILEKNTHYSYRYELQFNSPEENDIFIQRRQYEENPFCFNENGILIFNSDGNIPITDVPTYLVEYFTKNTNCHNHNDEITEIVFPDGMYLKLRKSNSFAKINKIIEIRQYAKV